VYQGQLLDGVETIDQSKALERPKSYHLASAKDISLPVCLGALI
jgi:hypothetical protein